MFAVFAVLVLAQTANPYLELARELARELKFSAAIEQLQVARQVPNLDTAQRVEVLELLARCEVAEGRRAEAENAFVELLSLEPDRELNRDETSPKILSVFDDVKRRLFPDRPVSLVETVAPAGRVRVQLVDPFHQVVRVERLEKRGDGAWVATTLPVARGLVDFEQPFATEGRPTRWYLRATDAAGMVLGAVGSQQAPRVVEVLVVSSATAPTPRLRGTTLAGVIVGLVAVVAAGTAVGLQVDAQALAGAARDGTRPPGDWADTGTAANQRARTQATAAVGLFATAGAAGATSTVLFAW